MQCSNLWRAQILVKHYVLQVVCSLVLRGRRQGAAIHTGPGSALGAHPCVALSSGRQLDCTAFEGFSSTPAESGKSQGVWGTASPVVASQRYP